MRRSPALSSAGLNGVQNDEDADDLENIVVVGYEDGRLKRIDAAPTDVQEVKHGKWIKEWRDGFVNGKRNYELICPYCNFSYFDNQCGFIVPEHFNFCPNCGAKMDKEST